MRLGREIIVADVSSLPHPALVGEYISTNNQYLGQGKVRKLKLDY